jgi:hypothetical protein
MLTQAFYYFLLICELAILGLLMVGIYCKAKKIIEMYSVPADDQNFEHNVSATDHTSGYLVDMSAESQTGGLLGQTCEVQPNQVPYVTRH